MNIEKSSMKMMIAMMTILLAMTMNAYNDFRPLLGGWPIPVPDQGNVEKVKTLNMIMITPLLTAHLSKARWTQWTHLPSPPLYK